jgi:hypothetical protein
VVLSGTAAREATDQAGHTLGYGTATSEGSASPAPANGERSGLVFLSLGWNLGTSHIGCSFLVIPRA